MHELLLFGQIPSSQHDQLLNILAGVAAMQPVPILEKHMVFRPNKAAGSALPVQVGNAQDIQKSQVQALQAQVQGELFYIQLVADVADKILGEDIQEGADVDMERNEVEKPEVAPNAVESDKKSTKPERWTLQFRDLPEVARQRPVTSRQISDVPITSGDPMKFMSALDYSYVPRLPLIVYSHRPLSSS